MKIIGTMQRGKSTVSLSNAELSLDGEDTILIPPGQEWQLKNKGEESFTMSVRMPAVE